ncbi:kinase-like domain-containing protein [Ochromonadaceae sp. CCMP2298]|nr:kinase-like domain-containing protein [Ochromonadaceae sp. CCMP2298]
MEGWANVDFDEIELGDRIGGGGVGIIYKGWFKDEQVALKTLFDARVSGDLKQEYMDELLVMSKVSHSNIVRFLGASMTPPNLCFIMELCETSMFNLLHVDKVDFSMQEKVSMLVDVGSAMEYLHALSPSVIHRDLKSHNVLRAHNGVYKVCDFGLVKVKHTTAGTPAYMAPELIDNKPYNKSVDVFAFGVLLWEVVTTDIPCYGLDINEIRSRVLSNTRPRIPSFGFTPKLISLLERAWSQVPDNRPLFPDVVDELLQIERELPDTKYTENVKDHCGDALDGILGHK